jgi:hypothetical protein
MGEIEEFLNNCLANDQLSPGAQQMIEVIGEIMERLLAKAQELKRRCDIAKVRISIIF